MVMIEGPAGDGGVSLCTGVGKTGAVCLIFMISISSIEKKLI